MDRRALVRLASATAATLWLARSSWSQARFSTDPFSLGVASGSPQSDSVVLWTRLAGGTRGGDAPSAPDQTVRWEIADDEQFKHIVRQGQVIAPALLAHSVHAEVDGLAPDRWYFYRFMTADAVSAVGRTRTLPLPQASVSSLRLGYASCQKWEDGFFSAWRHLRDEQVDMVVFLGDYLYEYPGTSSRVRVPGGGWMVSLDDYRRRYALYKSDPDLQAMHQHCPWLLVWDDHEVQNDYAGLQAGDSGPRDPAKPADFAQRRAMAYQAYYEHMPLRASVLERALTGSGAAALRIHQRLQFGRLVCLHLLDDRQYRDPQVCTRGGRLGSSTVNPTQCAQWDDPQRSLLGQAQERWLDASLSGPETSQSRWNVLAQQTVFGKRDFKIGPGESLSNDGWDGYGAARRRLTDQLRRHAVPNPVLLGGDIHANWVGHVQSDYSKPHSQTIGVEFCGTSITSHGAAPALDQTAQRLAENPHFVFADGQRRGYGVAAFSADRLTTTLRAVDDVARRDSGVSTLASFSVPNGHPRIERVL